MVCANPITVIYPVTDPITEMELAHTVGPAGSYKHEAAAM